MSKTAMPPQSDALVLFGATGDLAAKKIYPALYDMTVRGALRIPVVGVARDPMDCETLIQRVRQSVQTRANFNETHFATLAGLLRYVGGDYKTADTYTRLRHTLGNARHPLHYLAIPPAMFSVVVEGLGAAACTRDARVIVEKPFGRDLHSAQALSKTLESVFDEHAVFRIDHYLGKEPVQNLLYFRFANSFMEPIWRRGRVKSVQITMAEAFGIGSRGAFYEEVGALRDVVQNHLLQVVGILAMDPPENDSTSAMHAAKIAVLRSARPLSPADVVRGQYIGYRDEPGVATQSQVETYVAVRLFLDSTRWAGVPFYIRAGKRLPLTATEVVVQLSDPVPNLFPDLDGIGNYVRFRLGPDRVAIALGARVKSPGEKLVGEDVELFVCNERDDEADAYERLISDAMKGDHTLFALREGVEASWRVIEPLIDTALPVLPYAPGSWGPEEADHLLDDGTRWYAPRVTL
ncbi:MAG TPA: glucose-6-phosphate dehydrogenase [Burkholderiales bacterium]|nr:glucose-6-phosphate dehydrogenase [Burkholderiales bacterium]